MMDLNEIAVYIKVVQAGSFSAAARVLQMPNSTVSAKVASLEARLGVTLIRRTTRKLHVTEAGRDFFERCTRGLEEISSAEEEIKMSQSEPAGLLRVTAPVELGSVLLPPVVAVFKRKFPKVELEFVLTDQSIDLVGQGIDLAIRAGDLPSSSLRAKKLGSVYFALFAAKSYLKTSGALIHPKNLQEHCCLHFPPIGAPEWKLSSGKNIANVSLKNKISMNDLNGLKALAVAGQGIALLPTFLCQAELKSEKLVRVLPEWRTQLRPVHFVYAEQKFASLKVRTFIETAGEHISQSLRDSES
jgi:DNA-binding transcriptional LysR family regulator